MPALQIARFETGVDRIKEKPSRTKTGCRRSAIPNKYCMDLKNIQGCRRYTTGLNFAWFAFDFIRVYPCSSVVSSLKIPTSCYTPRP